MFEVGQTVKVVNNNGIAAEIGATAVIYHISKEYIHLNWKTNFHFQCDGAYYPSHFIPVETYSKQLHFEFKD